MNNSSPDYLAASNPQARHTTAPYRRRSSSLLANSHHESIASNDGAEGIPISPAEPIKSNEQARRVLDKSWRGGSSNKSQSRPSLLRRPASSPDKSRLTLLGGFRSSLKRPLPVDLPSTPLQKEPEPNKRTRRDTQRFHLDLSDVQSTPRRELPSPLFFSNTPQTRPPLPARYISYEAGAVTMRRSVIEDTSGVRTVKMARGSVHLGSSPDRLPRAASTPSARPLDLSLNARSMTLTEKEAAASGLQALSQVGILELLEQDDRIVFIVDLQNQTNFQPGPLQVIFANTPLKAYGSLMDVIRGRIADEASDMISGSSSFPEFKSWLTSFVRNGEPMDVALPNFLFAGVTWTSSTLKKRFRVISGVGPSAPPSITSNPPSTGLAVFAPNLKSATYLAVIDGGSQTEEPGDYFGHGSSPMTIDSGPVGEIFSSIESPNIPSASAVSNRSKQKRSQVRVSTKSSSPLNQAVSPVGTRPNEAILRAASSANVDPFSRQLPEQGFFDWTRLPISAALPRHIQFARSIDWTATSLGPIESWSLALRSMCNLMMASPHPAAMYWGEDNVALYNEAYIMLAGQKHPRLMGLPYSEAWKEIWDTVKDSFAAAKITGQATMKDDDCLFIDRFGFLEETYFSWSIIPLVGDDGSVVGLYNPAFEKTRRKIAERRMLTLRDIGDRTAAAREVKSFWGQVLKGLEENEYDTPFVLLYSVGDDNDSDGSSMHSNSILSAKQCILEGTLPQIPEGHSAAPAFIDLKAGTEGFASVFREAISMDKPVLLETSNGTFDESLIEGIEFRGFKETPRAAVVCPIHPTTGETIIGFLVLGINPRRPYDDDYNLFVQLLSRQLATSMASVVLFEEEIRRGQRAAKLAALDRIELSEQLAARTKEAVESETKFTRMAEFAPVGMFIADRNGEMVFTNDTFHDISRFPKEDGNGSWMDYVQDDDKTMLIGMWDDLIHRAKPLSAEFRFQSAWQDRNGNKGDNWVLGSAYPETDSEGNLKSVFGSITNISQQKWAEGYQRQRMEEAVELKRQQSNFIDMTSHEMRNPLSAILQCADEISGSLTEFKNNPNGKDIPLNLLDSNIDAAQTIALCANHQTRIVSDVLTLSKLDSALLLVTPVDIQPATIVQQALKMFEGELATADITMQFIRDKSLEKLNIDWVRLDPSRLLQVLINLTTNAIKFTTTQRKRVIKVTLSASTETPSKMGLSQVSYIPARAKKTDITEGKDWGTGEGVYLSFSVQDTGKGLSEDEKKLLFLRFSQASPKTHVQYGGSGLGLFISRELVELQGGQIGVSSEAGKGSTFAFYIKARRSAEPKDPKDHISPAGTVRKPSLNKSSKSSMNLKLSPTTDLLSAPDSSLSYLKVLIVEDNLVNQRVLSKQLRNLQCTVHVANHGGECIEHLKKTRYWVGREKNGTECSVILMDLEMPVMDGLTCTRKIREYQRTGEVTQHLPIIAV